MEGVAIEADETILLRGDFIYTQSKYIVVAVVNYSKVYFIVPYQTKATGLALRWNYKSIRGIKAIYKSQSFIEEFLVSEIKHTCDLIDIRRRARCVIFELRRLPPEPR